MSTPPLASGPQGPSALRPLLDTVLHALDTGARARGGPLPAGGPGVVAARLRETVGEILPDQGDPHALHALVHAFAEGAADPAHPLCAAHLHCPPLAVATAADLAASALNPSLDSWDQAPAASELETMVAQTLAREIYETGQTATPDSLITTGGTESNQLALLLAREACGGTVRLVTGANAHHSLPRAAWLLGLPEPVVVPAPGGTLDPAGLDEALTHLPRPSLVAATAGTTDAGLIDPLPEIAARCAAHGARLHIDAAYGGGLLFSDQHRTRLTGLDTADTVTLDLHKLGWQPVAAGLLAVRDTRDLTALRHRADYLNAADDTEAGLPDLLGRSLRTTRRPDVLKLAVTLKTLGRRGLAALVDQVCARAREFAALVHDHPGLELHAPPAISTVLFRPAGATDATVAAVRRALLTDGRAVLGRARLDGRLWLKATLLNPATGPDDLAALLHLVAARRATLAEGHTPR
ncbi:pyridoxal phosphate-dependent decarboxylase family protein [Streptomyces lomondensis]|uniref:Amino acid decarboxylase n=1 Tax=Streptomyces lomondensis TaxID=68229 RepID=A0ABQ2WYQ0_9ACTN|nr:aminotransferase class V-fold PLP-dependent enzyme [Streptomyces lomondensis]MCF0076853.1 aminotransferase class V-fold PLP-dependent enzyme [Streptomyces lomondensis]GGW84671.1 amino acid decarboxylase [Streptomyces lomondensis]